MTLKSRNRYLAVSFLLTIPAIILYIYALFSFLKLDPYAMDNMRLPLLNSDLITDLIMNGIFLIVSLFSAIIIFWNFRKTTSIEIFFLICFLISSTLYTVRPLLVLLHINGAALTGQLALIKLTFFAHILSLMMLFFSGFYKTGFESTRSEWSFAGTLLISFILIGIQPVDLSILSSKLNSSYGIIPSLLEIRSIAQADFFLFFTISLFVMSVVNYLIIWYQTRIRSYLVLAASVACIQLSLAFFVYKLPWQLEAFAMGLYSFAVILFAVQTHQIYKWS